jgi:hypothetical protein
MIYNEEVALQKWCPMMKTVMFFKTKEGEETFGERGGVSFNRHIDGEAEGDCIASGCMMWRSNDIYECPGCKRIFTDNHISCCKDTIKLTDVGYCGLAGKP